MTKQLHFQFSLSCIGEGNGNPLQCSCLENPRDGGGWWAAIYGVAQSRTRLKWLSSSSSSSLTAHTMLGPLVWFSYFHKPIHLKMKAIFLSTSNFSVRFLVHCVYCWPGSDSQASQESRLMNSHCDILWYLWSQRCVRGLGRVEMASELGIHRRQCDAQSSHSLGVQ